MFLAAKVAFWPMVSVAPFAIVALEPVNNVPPANVTDVPVGRLRSPV